MSFLLFDEKSQDIKVSPEAKNLDALVTIRDKDNTADKKHYNNTLKFIYHTYKKEHIFTNLSISERKIKTSELYLNGADFRKYEQDEDVLEVIRLYISLEYSQNEWTYQKLKIDINDIKAHINEIPMKKTKLIDQMVDVECICEKCEQLFIKKVPIKVTIDIDNSKERMESLKQILTLQDMEEKFRDIIVREKKMKEHNQNNSLTLIEQGLKNQI